MAAGGFAMRFEQVMFYLGPIVQVLYWTVISVCAVAAVRLLKRWVDHATSRGEAAASTEVRASTEGPIEPEIDIEPFVE